MNHRSLEEAKYYCRWMRLAQHITKRTNSRERDIWQDLTKNLLQIPFSKRRDGIKDFAISSEGLAPFFWFLSFFLFSSVVFTWLFICLPQLSTIEFQFSGKWQTGWHFLKSWYLFVQVTCPVIKTWKIYIFGPLFFFFKFCPLYFFITK